MKKSQRPQPCYCAQCGEKRIFLSEMHARKGILFYMEHAHERAGEHEFGSLNVYQCPIGNGWHFGHNWRARVILNR